MIAILPAHLDHFGRYQADIVENRPLGAVPDKSNMFQKKSIIGAGVGGNVVRYVDPRIVFAAILVVVIIAADAMHGSQRQHQPPGQSADESVCARRDDLIPEEINRHESKEIAEPLSGGEIPGE